ncbi:ferredoxin [Terrisporobacter sp.]
MKAYVDDATCIGCETCPKVCPEVFHMTDEGIAHAIDGKIPEDVQGKAEQAAESCPVEAIDLGD